MIVSGSHDKTIKIWCRNVDDSWKCCQTINEHTNLVNCVIISSDSSMIITGADDNNIKVHKQLNNNI